jgi:predicted small secreted protein
MMRAILLAAILALAGCNTVSGIGQDISGAARTVQRMF